MQNNKIYHTVSLYPECFSYDFINQNIMTRSSNLQSILSFIVDRGILFQITQDWNKYVKEFIEKYFNEERLALLKQMDDKTAIMLHYYYKAYLLYLFEDYINASESIELAENYLEGVTSSALVPLFYFYDSLIHLAIYPKSNKRGQKRIRKRVRKNQKKLKKWAEYAPMNIAHKYYLVEAEFARVQGKDGDARQSYDKAIELAKETKSFINEEALANELAARFYFSRKHLTIANFYLRSSHYLYKQWGAESKIKYLENKYPQCKKFEAIPLSELTPSTTSIGTQGASSGTQLLDINTIVKASRAIFGEIEMKKLLRKLIKITIENAGAQKGILILSDDNNQLLIQGEGEIHTDKITVMQSMPIDKSKNLSPAIVRYVVKKQESVVLDDATESGAFTSDHYVIRNKPKSLLCMPIIEQKSLMGVLYLENNITTGAFTQNRLEVLKLLASQIAISIKNATLIQNLREQERLQKEMEIASRIQTSILPVSPTHNELDITAIMRPAEEVGGDYYDLIFDNENNLWFAIGDVSGHGVTAGLIMIMAQSTIYSSIKGDETITPKDAIVKVNRILTENIRHRLNETHFMTMCLVEYIGNGRFITAGLHIDILIYRKQQKKCEFIVKLT